MCRESKNKFIGCFFFSFPQVKNGDLTGFLLTSNTFLFCQTYSFFQQKYNFIEETQTSTTRIFFFKKKTCTFENLNESTAICAKSFSTKSILKIG